MPLHLLSVELTVYEVVKQNEVAVVRPSGNLVGTGLKLHSNKLFAKKTLIALVH